MTSSNILWDKLISEDAKAKVAFFKRKGRNVLVNVEG